jgi:hypothetical protein
VPDQADPTGGRHAFDADAALTPIFTTLRRGGWRRQRGPQGFGPRRPVPDAVDRFHDDPPTAPIPVVPALYAVDPDCVYPAPPAEPYPGHSFVPQPSAPPPSNLETTTWWPAPVPADPHPVEYGRTPYEPIPDPSYDDRGHYDPSEWGMSGSGAWGRGSSGRGSWGDDRGPYDRRTYDPNLYDPNLYDPNLYDPNFYDPVTDTGRHHRRLAPAGW